jgi:dTDP-4-dehydrorhamnose 3,5-epimerase
MKVTPTHIPDLLILEPDLYHDERGFFYESFNQQAFSQATGLDLTFVQDNHSRSAHGVLRGLHYQLSPCAQGKLVRCIRGAVWDVALDIRKSSATFGQWAGVDLTDSNHRQFWIPAGFAHGFVVLGDSADFLYKTTAYYAPESDRCILWDDPEIKITWPLTGFAPQLSSKDLAGKLFRDAEVFD